MWRWFLVGGCVRGSGRSHVCHPWWQRGVLNRAGLHEVGTELYYLPWRTTKTSRKQNLPLIWLTKFGAIISEKLGITHINN